MFANVLLVDEINRATPKTQSSLLEAMQERRVSVDGTTYELPKPFLVLATQNPIELAGTFPLPEAQLDRFLFKLTLGYPDRAAEVDVLRDQQAQRGHRRPRAGDQHRDRRRHDGVGRPASPSSEAMKYYIVDLCQAHPHRPRADDGCLDPRRAGADARRHACSPPVQGREDVIPDDVKALVKPVLVHRLHPHARRQPARGDRRRTSSTASSPGSRCRWAWAPVRGTHNCMAQGGRLRRLTRAGAVAIAARPGTGARPPHRHRVRRRAAGDRRLDRGSLDRVADAVSCSSTAGSWPWSCSWFVARRRLAVDVDRSDAADTHARGPGRPRSRCASSPTGGSAP